VVVSDPRSTAAFPSPSRSLIVQCVRQYQADITLSRLLGSAIVRGIVSPVVQWLSMHDGSRQTSHNSYAGISGGNVL
jgi:hypothetical protein